MSLIALRPTSDCKLELPAAAELPVHFTVMSPEQDHAQVSALEVRLHHAVFDGYSMNLLLDRLINAYTSNDGTIIRHSDFGTYARNYLLYQTDIDKRFWHNLLSGSEPTLLRAAVGVLCV